MTTKFDWATFIVCSPRRDKERLIAEEKELEFYRNYRVYMKEGSAPIIEMMLHYFEDDPKLADKYATFLEDRGIPHRFKDAEVLLQFLNHLRHQTEEAIIGNG